MLGAKRWSLLAAVLAGWLLAVPAQAVVPQVHDHGKFFDPATVEKANALIKKIDQTYKKEVVVETFRGIPEERLKKHPYQEPNNNDKEYRKKYYDEWVSEIAREQGAN